MQSEAVIIEVPTVQMLRLGTNPWQVHEESMNVTYSQAGFHSGQASYLNMKVLVFTEPGHMLFLLNPC